MAMTVIVSGGSDGIGAAVVRRFGADGARVFNLDISAPKDPDPHARWLRCDVTDPASVSACVQRVLEEAGSLEVAVANAGVSTRKRFLEMTTADFERELRVNLFGVLNVWQSAGREMWRARHGVLLATASTNGSVGYPFYSAYNASKAAVLALMRTVALELAPYVRTACVSPGYVLTDMQRREYSDEMLASVNDRIPSGRHASPDEIAHAFAYLASDGAAFMTGQQLILDGGELAGGTASRFATEADENAISG